MAAWWSTLGFQTLGTFPSGFTLWPHYAVTVDGNISLISWTLEDKNSVSLTLAVVMSARVTVCPKVCTGLSEHTASEAPAGELEQNWAGAVRAATVESSAVPTVARAFPLSLHLYTCAPGKGINQNILSKTLMKNRDKNDQAVSVKKAIIHNRK